MIRAVVFDLGGALEHTGNDVLMAEFAPHKGHPIGGIRQADSRLNAALDAGALSEEAVYRELFRRLGSPGVPLPSDSPFSAGYRDGLAIDPRMIALVRRLRRLGCQVGLLSNTNPIHANRFRNAGLFGEFDQVVLSYEIGMLKPAPKSMPTACAN